MQSAKYYLNRINLTVWYDLILSRNIRKSLSIYSKLKYRFKFTWMCILCLFFKKVLHPYYPLTKAHVIRTHDLGNTSRRTTIDSTCKKHQFYGASWAHPKCRHFVITNACTWPVTNRIKVCTLKFHARTIPSRSIPKWRLASSSSRRSCWSSLLESSLFKTEERHIGKSSYMARSKR